jgi:hypothetical protein
MKILNQLGLLLSLSAFVCLAVTARAQTGMSHTTTTSTTTSESDNPIPPQGVGAPAHTTQDFLMSKTFGSKATSGLSGCKTEEASKDVLKDLNTQCMAWMNDKHAEMKEKYVTGTCEESCSDCGMSMQRCSMKGVIHYAK